MSGAFIVLLAILVVSILVVVVFMVVLRKGTFAKVEDVHERLAKERQEHGLPTATLNPNGSDAGDDAEPSTAPAEGVPEAQEQVQAPDQTAPTR